MARVCGQRRGISLLLVMAFVSVASVMGMAILSSGTLQMLGSRGQGQAAQADALAESGLNLGFYYLQNLSNSSKCPLTLVLGGRTYVVNRVSLGAAVPGNFDLSIVRTGLTTYRVTATGRAISATSTVTRQMWADVNVQFYGYGLNVAAGSPTISANTTITGNVYSAVPLVNNGTITGTLYANSFSGSGLAGSVLPVVQAPGYTPVPTPVNINHYTSYVYNGRTYLAGTVGNLLSNVTLGPTDTNPAGVYTRSGTLKVQGNVVINGTLVVIGGHLQVEGTGNQITPASGFPAAVIDYNLSYTAQSSEFTANGLVWLGGSVNTDGGGIDKAGLTINGNLLSPSASALFDPIPKIAINYDRTRSSVATLATSSYMPAPTSLTITTWKN